MKNPNVIFFTIDGLRADQIFGESKSALTPNIDLLIKKGTLFSSAFSSADGTTLSFNTIFNSLFPFKTGVRTTKIFLGENNIFQTNQRYRLQCRRLQTPHTHIQNNKPPAK